MEISSIFKKVINPRSIYQFVSNVYYSEKLTELSSFIVWEIKYLLRLYSKNDILSFNIESHPIIYKNMNIDPSNEELASHGIQKSSIKWSIVFIDGEGNYWGKVFGSANSLHKISENYNCTQKYEFSNSIQSLYIDKQDSVFCSVLGTLYMYAKGAEQFVEVLKFSTSSSYFRQDAFTESPNGDLLIGEYANIFENKKWKFVGYMYHSNDGGKNWVKIDFLKGAKINKHIHILKWSYSLNGLIMTDGDNQKNIWFNSSKTEFHKISSDASTGWKKLNKRHIDKGGHTSFNELDGEIYLGTDYNGGTNFLSKTKDLVNYQSKVVPNPYRRSVFQRIAIRKCQNGSHEVWASLKFKHSSKVRSLLMMSRDNCATWNKIIEYDGTTVQVDIISESVQSTNKIYLSVREADKNLGDTYVIN